MSEREIPIYERPIAFIGGHNEAAFFMTKHRGLSNGSTIVLDSLNLAELEHNKQYVIPVDMIPAAVILYLRRQNHYIIGIKYNNGRLRSVMNWQGTSPGQRLASNREMAEIVGSNVKEVALGMGSNLVIPEGHDSRDAQTILHDMERASDFIQALIEDPNIEVAAYPIDPDDKDPNRPRYGIFYWPTAMRQAGEELMEKAGLG